jgi:thioredoxin-dependent peroxiredoxin
MVEEGLPTPDFELATDTGERIRLSGLRGARSSSTSIPRTTRRAARLRCELRDQYSLFRERGVVVLGVSPDDEASHARFREKYSLPFTLLADPGHRVANDYGAWVERNGYGRKSMGIERSTFVIDEHGNVARALGRVKPEGHAERVLAALPG